MDTFIRVSVIYQKVRGRGKNSTPFSNRGLKFLKLIILYGDSHMSILVQSSGKYVCLLRHTVNQMTNEIVLKARELKELCLKQYVESPHTSWDVDINDETSDEWMYLTVSFGCDQSVFKLFDGLLAMCTYRSVEEEVKIICLETILEIVKIKHQKILDHAESMKAKFNKTA